ncbi:hypothetical protein BV22DRAFT_1015059, partial [Leucogyrophana mollusca]
VIADLCWIDSLLSMLPNTMPFASVDPVDLGWWDNASTSFGVGVVVGIHWAVWR